MGRSRQRKMVEQYIRYHFKVKDPERTANTLCDMAFAAGIDPMAQLVAAKGWLDLHNHWHKYRQWSRFLFNWFSNAIKYASKTKTDEGFDEFLKDFKEGREC